MAYKRGLILNKSSHQNDKIILDLCGGTGAWSKPYKDAVYDVRNITLPEYDVRTYIPPENVYGILAAPPCTMFSLARTRAKTPRNFYEGMETVEACLKIIWDCRKNPYSILKFWVLENPMGFLRQFLGKPALTFDPCDYGDRYTKKTDLWGYFDEPIKNPVDLNQQELYKTKQNSRKIPSINEITSSKQADRRSITPPHFAKAFFEVNK